MNDREPEPPKDIGGGGVSKARLLAILSQAAVDAVRLRERARQLPNSVLTAAYRDYAFRIFALQEDIKADSRLEDQP